MNQKRNKIIVLVGVIIIVSFIVVVYYQNEKYSSNRDLSSPKSIYLAYELCREEYLEKLQVSSGGTVSMPPQVFCKVENNTVDLIPNNIIAKELQIGKTIIMVVNVPQLMDQKYFDSMTKYFDQPSFKVPEKNFYLCVNYKPSFATLFGFSNKSNESSTNNTSCAFFDSLEKVTPLGIAAQISINTKGENFGLSILIPNINTTSLPKTILSKEEIQEIIDQQQYFMLYDINLPIQ